MFNKKGALELSINAIIVIVIAFVFLGLGLGFIQTQLKDVGSSTTEIQETIRNQLIEDIRESNKRLSFPTSQFKLSTEEEIVNGVAIKNTDDYDGNFSVKFQVQSEDGNYETFSPSQALDNGAKILWDNSVQTLGPGDYNVVRFTLTAPNMKGNYLYRVRLMKEGQDTPYDSTTFFVRTN
jgi:hypothetical protein